MHVHKPPQRVKTARGESKFSTQRGPLTCHAVLRDLYRHVKPNACHTDTLWLKKQARQCLFQRSWTPVVRSSPRCTFAHSLLSGCVWFRVGCCRRYLLRPHTPFTPRGPSPPGSLVVSHPVLGFLIQLVISLNTSHSVDCGGCFLLIYLNPCHFHFYDV